MREIKFRAWDGYRMFYFDNHQFDLIYNDICGWNVMPNLPSEKLKGLKWTTGQSSETAESFSLMQYTGLKDKNGKEIYEGDLVAEIDKIEDLKKWGVPLTVAFGTFKDGPDDWGLHYCTTGFILEYNGSSKGEFAGIHDQIESSYGFLASKLMVIGNIYEHPHLLNQ